jgi:hypothetical protein
MRYLLELYFCRKKLHFFTGWKCRSIAVKGAESAVWFERKCLICRKTQEKYF